MGAPVSEIVNAFVNGTLHFMEGEQGEEDGATGEDKAYDVEGLVGDPGGGSVVLDC